MEDIEDIEVCGVHWEEEDRGLGPFRLRVSGSGSDFVSSLSPVEVVEGWENKSALTFDTLEEALAAGKIVYESEGCRMTLEPCDVL